MEKVNPTESLTKIPVEYKNWMKFLKNKKKLINIISIRKIKDVTDQKFFKFV